MPDRPANEPRQIFIGNVSYDAVPEDVVLALREVGVDAERVRLATFKETGAPRGFGFLDLSSREKRSTEEVIEHINASVVDLLGRVLRAAKAHERPPKPAPDSGRAHDGDAWNNKKAKKPKRGGSRGHGTTEFKRGRHEFEGD